MVQATYDGMQHCTALQEKKGKSVATYCPYTGKGEELSPKELAGAGLAGCMAVSIVSILNKNNQPFRDLEIRVHAAQNDDFPQVYTRFDLGCVIYGTGIVERIVDLEAF